jgi:hypothetical protein
METSKTDSRRREVMVRLTDSNLMGNKATARWPAKGRSHSITAKESTRWDTLMAFPNRNLQPPATTSTIPKIQTSKWMLSSVFIPIEEETKQEFTNIAIVKSNLHNSINSARYLRQATLGGRLSMLAIITNKKCSKSGT